MLILALIVGAFIGLVLFIARTSTPEVPKGVKARYDARDTGTVATERILRPLTAAEVAGLAKSFCSSCEGRGWHSSTGQLCSCTRPKVQERVKAGAIMALRGTPYSVEEVPSSAVTALPDFS